MAFVFPCDDLGETISGNPPQDDQLLCDTDRLIALDDGVSFRFAEPVAAEPVVRAERAVQIGTEGNEIVGGIALDGAGNRYVFGASDGSLGGTLDEESSIFVAQYTSDGSPGWVFELGMANGSLLFDAVADDEHLYAVGRPLGSLPGFTNQGRWDAVLLKLRLGDGALIDSDQFGTSSSDMFRRLVIDGDVLIAAGYTYGDSPAAGGHNLDRSMTTGDVLIQRFDRSLEPLGAVQLGTAHEDRGHIAVRDGLVHVGGMTEAAFAGESRGAFDAFLVVLGEDLE